MLWMFFHSYPMSPLKHNLLGPLLSFSILLSSELLEPTTHFSVKGKASRIWSLRFNRMDANA